MIGRPAFALTSEGKSDLIISTLGIIYFRKLEVRDEKIAYDYSHGSDFMLYGGLPAW
jgi:hypothetical protein